MKHIILFTCMAVACLFVSCGDEELKPSPSPSPTPSDTTKVDPVAPDDDTIVSEFVKGADISWYSQMAAEGHRFYDWNSREAQDCPAVMKSLGMEAIRLRVWVDPEDGYNGKDDVLEKARNVTAQGMDLMIAFHYSDTWARRTEQTVPLGWVKHSYEEMLADVRNHTREVLMLLKDNDITVKWVQIGNETDKGLLWPAGHADGNPDQYAAFISAGAEAARSVYPESKIIVHLSNAYDQRICKQNLDILRQYNVSYDLVGLSLYPCDALNMEFQTANKNRQVITSEEDAIGFAIQNMNFLYNTYTKPSMLVEVGLPVRYETKGALLMSNIMIQARESGICEGVFYWEPESYDGWQGYDKGAFLSNGHPTQILNAFER